MSAVPATSSAVASGTSPSPAWPLTTWYGCRGAKSSWWCSRTMVRGRPQQGLRSPSAGLRRTASLWTQTRMRTPAHRTRPTTAEPFSVRAAGRRGAYGAAPAAGRTQLHAVPAAPAGAGLARGVLRRADALAGFTVATDRDRRLGLRADLALPDVCRRPVAVLAALPAVDRLRGHGHGVDLASRLSAGVLHGSQIGQVEEHPAGAGDRALLHQLPDPHPCLADHSHRQRTGGGSCPLDPPHQSVAVGAADEQRLADELALCGDLRSYLQLPSLHDPAALRQSRAPRP